jgi:hypothetical protein
LYHHSKWLEVEGTGLLTVDCNGDAFGQYIAICANESGDFAQFVDLEKVGRSFSASLDLYNLEVELVCLCNELDGR